MSGGTIKAGTLTTTTGAGSVIIPAGVQFTAKGTMTGHMAPTFCVYRDYNDGGYQSIGNNSFTKAQWNAKYWDTNSDFDITTNYRFTASVAGLYQMGTGIAIDNIADQAYIRVSIYKNGSETNPNAQGLNMITESSGTTPHQANVSTLIDVDVGDYFEVYIKHNHGSSRDWRTEYGNTFWGMRIGSSVTSTNTGGVTASDSGSSSGYGGY
jgi:hypothetical protein